MGVFWYWVNSISCPTTMEQGRINSKGRPKNLTIVRISALRWWFVMAVFSSWNESVKYIKSFYPGMIFSTNLGFLRNHFEWSVVSSSSDFLVFWCRRHQESVALYDAVSPLPPLEGYSLYTSLNPIYALEIWKGGDKFDTLANNPSKNCLRFSLAESNKVVFRPDLTR